MAARASRFRRLSTATAAVTTLVVALAGAPPTSAAEGVGAPPVVHGSAAPVVGSTITASDLRDRNGRNDYTRLTYEISWSSPSPDVERFDVYALYAGTEPDLLGSFPAGSSSASSVVDEASDYNGDFGGGSFADSGWYVEAVDTEGQVGSVDVGHRPRVVQTDDLEAGSPVRFGRGWRVRSCDCASGGLRATTRRAGATARIRPPVDAGPPTPVALVMSEGPRRGRAVILVDGRRVAVVDMHAPTRRDRVVTWVGDVGAGSVVEVRNRGTRGHPRIDLDALVL